MSIYIDEMKELQLYNREFWVPIEKNDKKKNACILLLTPDHNSSKELITNPKMLNVGMFESYYMERNVNFIINNKSELVSESSILEQDIASADYGLPELKKYPMPDETHVLSAIKFFNYVDPKNEKELASNINRKIKQYHMQDKIHVGDKNRFKNYFNSKSSENSKEESVLAPNIILDDKVIVTESYAQTKDNLYIFNEANEKFNPILKKLLYNERIKSNKEVLLLYDKLQEEIPFIKRAYLRLELYKQYNLFVDWSYYSELFFKNNKLKKDKALALYFDFLDRFISDSRLTQAGYIKKTVLVPVDGWSIEKDSELWDYNKNLNPFSLINRWIRTGNNLLYKQWNGIKFVFISASGLFSCSFENLNKMNLNKFISNIRRLQDKTPVVDTSPVDSKDAITTTIVSQIEKMSGNKIKIHNLNGANKRLSANDIENAVLNRDSITDNEKKDTLVSLIKNTVDNSANAQDAIQSIENDDLAKKLIVDLAMDSDDGVKFSATRISRMSKLNDEFLRQKLKDSTVEELLKASKVNQEIKKRSLPVDSIDDEWKDLTFINFEDAYDMDQDIANIFYSLSSKSIPIAVRHIEVEDISTSEDYLYLYKVECEDAYGKRFTVSLEIPKLKDNRYMRLHGNDKILSGQLLLLPIIKTDVDTVQVVSNYNKIFIRRYGNNTGKSFVVTDKIHKALSKYVANKGTKIKVSIGDNSRICNKYELPIDYIDLASAYNTIESDSFIIYFNQDKIREVYKNKIDPSKGIPVGYNKKFKRIEYIKSWEKFSDILYRSLAEADPKFNEYYVNTSESVKYTYSKASILNTEIPLIVVMAYSEGLQTALKKANVRYEILDKRPTGINKNMQDIIRFNDGYLVYTLDFNSSLLLNGLKECNTEDYSIKDINSKAMWTDFLDIFGGRITADGLDNFYDLMIDPITAQTCREYNLPNDYVSILAYANQLLVDNKYNRHIDITGNRLRTNEIISGYVYKAISKAYGDYQRQLKRTKKDATFSCKRSAVVDAILLDPTESDASTLSPILDREAASAVSFKGLSGMNSDRSYGLDKRTYDESMLNVLAMSTGFAANVGLTRWATIDSNITGKRGYIKQTNKPSELSDTKTLSITEALTPFGTTSDDPFRTAMTFIQTSKHGMRVKHGMPMLVSNGADEALAYMTGNTFSFKAKRNGTVKELTNEHIVIQYDDGKYDFVDLRPLTKKNSDGGFYTVVKLDANVHKGQKIKANQVIAYDKLSYSKEVGDSDNIAYNIGTMAKTAILVTDEGFEDSAIVDEGLCEMMSSDIVVKKEVTLNKLTNIYNMKKVGDEVQEGDTLIIFQNSYEDADANALLKTLSADVDEINDLGRITLKSKVTGVIQDIKLYRTVEKSELSPSLKKLFNEYEANIKKTKSTMEKYHIDTKEFDADYKLSDNGKLKKVEDGVLIEFYIKYHDKMSVGDKIVYYSALKGTIKSIFPEGKEPYTDRRPKEKIRAFLTASSINKRMVGSIIKVGAIQKVLVELDRAVKEMNGIKYEDNL